MLGGNDEWPQFTGGAAENVDYAPGMGLVPDTDMVPNPPLRNRNMSSGHIYGAGAASPATPGTPTGPGQNMSVAATPASPDAEGESHMGGDGDGVLGDYIIEELSGVAQADVDKHQILYLHYQGTPTGQLATEWKKAESIVAAKAANPVEDLPSYMEALPVSMSLKLIQAPAAFARPMVHKKRFKPTFKIRAELKYKQSLNTQITIRASTLADSGFAKPELFDPELADANQEMDNNDVTRTLITPTGEGGNPDEEKVLTADFDFTDLRFIKSSRMFKRWLVFHCKLGADVLYCIYDLPSVIVSRRNDQYSKAYELLMGGPPPVKRQRPAASSTPTISHVPARRPSGIESMHIKRFTAGELLQWIDQQYNIKLPGTTRRLSHEDKTLLLRKAGLEPNTTEAVVIPYHSWVAFEEWYTKCLEALNAVADVWDKTNPLVICGMSMDRIQSEALLMMEGLGAFIVRLSSEPGCFAVSTRVIKGNMQTCDHLLLDRVDLQRRPLMRWIQAHEPAQILIDINTRQKYLKDQIMHTGYFITPKTPHIEPGEGYLTDHTQGVIGNIPSFSDIGNDPQGILAGLDLVADGQGSNSGWGQPQHPIPVGGNMGLGGMGLDMDASGLNFQGGGLPSGPDSIELMIQEGIGGQGQQWGDMGMQMGPMGGMNMGGQGQGHQSPNLGPPGSMGMPPGGMNAGNWGGMGGNSQSGGWTGGM